MKKGSFALVPAIMGRMRVLLDLLKDWLAGRYSRTPWYLLGGCALAVLYVLNPFDVVPDYLPVIGWLDDTVMLFIVWRFVRKDIVYYELWRQSGRR